jgi:hypothetical protein
LVTLSPVADLEHRLGAKAAGSLPSGEGKERPTTTDWIAVNAVSITTKRRTEVIGSFAATASAVNVHESGPAPAANINPLDTWCGAVMSRG